MKLVTLLRYLILAAIIGFAVWRIWPHIQDFPKLIALKDQINYAYIFAAIGTQFFQYIGDGWLSQIFLSMINVKVRMHDTVRIASLNVLAAHMLPVGDAGGLLIVYSFYKKLGVMMEQFIFLTICWGFITNFVLFALLIASFLFLPELPLPFHPTLGLGILVMLTCIGLMIGYVNRHTLFRLINSHLGKYPVMKDIVSLIHNRHIYWQLVLKRPPLLLYALIAVAIYYGSNLATLSFSFLAFGRLPSFALIAFAYTASLVAGRITLAPAGVGAAEATLLLVFLGAGIDPNIALAVVLVFRFISFWLPIPAGLYSYVSLRHDRANGQPTMPAAHLNQDQQPIG